jgi:hypothetical protein
MGRRMVRRGVLVDNVGEQSQSIGVAARVVILENKIGRCNLLADIHPGADVLSGLAPMADGEVVAKSR